MMDELIEWCEQERRHGPRVRDYGEADKKYKAIIQALRELQSCQIESSRKDYVISDLRGTIAKETCGLCNFMERADCFNQKEQLRAELQSCREENERLREGVGWQDVVDWADGIQGAMGTEYADRIDDIEAMLSYKILQAYKGQAHD